MKTFPSVKVFSNKNKVDAFQMSRHLLHRVGMKFFYFNFYFFYTLIDMYGMY